MDLTHRFAHEETLVRARTWLAQLGFQPHQVESRAEGHPRITVTAESDRMAEIRMLINALELSDPDAFPSIWDEARLAPVKSADSEALPPERTPHPHTTVIGWHPHDPGPVEFPGFGPAREVMRQKWGGS